jgi:4-amino-4-deoxychorismate lyase
VSPLWLINGIRQDRVDADDRGLAYGDGLFETMAVREGVVRFFERHMARLELGCRRLSLPAPDRALIAAEIRSVRGGCPRGTVKLIMTRGRGPRGYAPPEHAEPLRILSFEPQPEPSQHGPLRVMVCKTLASTNPSLAGLKTLNRLDSVLASAEWRAEGYDEGLMLDTDGHLVGGTKSNIFLVYGHHLLTPRLDRGGICGVMRGAVLAAAAAVGIEAEEARLSPADLGQAEELFATNALWGVRAITHCAQRGLPTGPVTRQLAAAVRGLGLEVNRC